MKLRCPECGGKIKENKSYKELDDDTAEYKISVRCTECGFGAEMTMTEVHIKTADVYRKLMQRLATEGAASEYSNN